MVIFKNIDINIDIDMVIHETIDIDMNIHENIDKGVLQNINIKISILISRYRIG